MATIKEVIEGKPVRVPLHVALVHLPIALLPLGVLLDVASWIFARPELYLVRCAFIAIAAGIGTAIIAAVAGAVDYSTIRNDHPAKKTATLHMVLNLIAVGLFSLSLGLRYEALDLARTDLAPLIVSLIGLGVLGYSGYLGGDLVYNDGIGVGRHQRGTPLPEKTIQPQSVEGGSAVVGAAPLLKEAETLRVDVDGTVVAVARSAGKLCAFQDFCTHRYGPLSEGKIENGEVVCPWHGSRFSTATGKVTQGPAKIDLRSFPVDEKDGNVRVKV